MYVSLCVDGTVLALLRELIVTCTLSQFAKCASLSTSKPAIAHVLFVESILVAILTLVSCTYRIVALPPPSGSRHDLVSLLQQGVEAARHR